MVRRLSLASFTLLAGALASWACGPSFQTIYEGDARFEHCYALEENPNVGMPQKGECWRDWLAHYTYGQTRDRVMYAASRAQAIRRAPELPTDEAMMHAAPGEVEPRGWNAMPAPTSAFTPPAKTWGGDDAGTSAPLPRWNPDSAPTQPPARPSASASSSPSSASVASSSERPPLASCTDGCERSWSSCHASCKGDLCDSCAKPYRVCLRACAK